MQSQLTVDWEPLSWNVASLVFWFGDILYISPVEYPNLKIYNLKHSQIREPVWHHANTTHFQIWEDLRFCTVSYFWVLRLPSSNPFCLGISHKAIHGTSISPPAFLQDFCDHSHQTKHSSAPQRLATLETPSTAQLHEEKVNGSRFSEGDPSFHQDVISCCWNGEGSGFAILNPVLKGQIQRPSTYLVLSSIGSSWSHLA